LGTLSLAIQVQDQFDWSQNAIMACD